MGYELIVTEKPSAAQKIAHALADKQATKRAENGVPFYELTRNGKNIKVACAVGHLFTVGEDGETGWSYPSFGIKWVPSSDVSKSSAFTKKYANVIKKLAKDAESFTVATDFDIEGEVIGLMVIRHLCKQKDANRMKFSTLTKEDLIKAYDNKQQHIDWGQANAGVTRHELDWFYGINLSRALTLAIKAAGRYKTLSSGRVQGPALKMLVDKEREINAFIPEPYWQIRMEGEVNGEAIEAWHEKDKLFNEQEAKGIYEKAQGKDASVNAVDAKQFKQQPPVPFDLTSMQVEAYRVHKIQPKMTLSIAQDLYVGGFISYPRTSSQKLPKELGHKKLIEALLRQHKYAELAKQLLARKSLTPNEGKKTDDAHPAIYPTGTAPDKLDARQQKIYDLIVRRFLATFADEATRETMTIGIDMGGETFVAKGTRTVDPGWHVFYGPYAIFDEITLPKVLKSDPVMVKKLENLRKETKPPKRYTPASIIKELEKRNLGTKATRATIIDNLYDRGYLKAKSIEVTDLGMKTAQTLEKYSPEILDEALTREFEDEMEEIRQKKKEPQVVLDHAQKILTETLTKFKSKEKDVGRELLGALSETEDKESRTVLCPKCRIGTLMIKRGKFGRFLACDRYQEEEDPCSFTQSLPARGKVTPSGKNCESCGLEMITMGGKRTQNVCVNPDCESKKAKEGEDKKVPGEGEACQKCNKGTMVRRKSIYGEFLGCSAYPKCKNTKRI